jgi:hypothetical protein
MLAVLVPARGLTSRWPNVNRSRLAVTPWKRWCFVFFSLSRKYTTCMHTPTLTTCLQGISATCADAYIIHQSTVAYTSEYSHAEERVQWRTLASTVTQRSEYSGGHERVQSRTRASTVAHTSEYSRAHERVQSRTRASTVAHKSEYSGAQERVQSRTRTSTCTKYSDTHEQLQVHKYSRAHEEVLVQKHRYSSAHE